MMTDSKKYKVTICGELYTIVSDEPEHQLLQAINLVDSMMQNALQTATTIVDQRKIAILTALSIASKLIAAEASLETIRITKEKLLERIDCEVFDQCS